MKLNITLDEFVELRDYVHTALVDDGQNIPIGDLAVRLLSFAEKFDISAMLRFKNWMLDNGYGAKEVLAGVVHDLNDQDDNGFLPRTAGY